MKDSTIIVIVLLLVCVGGGIAALVVLLLNQDGDDESGSPGGGEECEDNTDCAAGEECDEGMCVRPGGPGGPPGETWNGTPSWNTEQRLVVGGSQQEGMFDHLELSPEELSIGGDVDEARKTCLRTAYDIHQEGNPVCGITFYPDVWGTPAEQLGVDPSFQNFPCQIFSNCTGSSPPVENAGSGSEALFTDVGLFCERGEGSDYFWKEIDMQNTDRLQLNRRYLNVSPARNFDTGPDRCSTTDELSREECESAANDLDLPYSASSDGPRGCSVVPEVAVYYNGQPTAGPGCGDLCSYVCATEENTIVKIGRETLKETTSNLPKTISEIRATCLQKAEEEDEDETQTVCGVNFYHRAFVTDVGDRRDDGSTELQGDGGYNENLGLSAYNYENPCQIFINCDSNPGYRLGEEKKDGGRALFTRSKIRCSNNFNGAFFA